MYTNIKFNEAAFRHNITESDIRRVLAYPRFDGAVDEEDENKYLVRGFYNKGNLLEIIYNIIDDQSINVFHAMKCRKAFLQYLDYQR
jgi:hypothetical protein